MRPDTDPPAQIADRVVSDRPSRMADPLKSVPANRAPRGPRVAGAHVDGVGGVADVEDSRAWAGMVGADAVAGRGGEAETGSGESVWEGFEGHGW